VRIAYNISWGDPDQWARREKKENIVAPKTPRRSAGNRKKSKKQGSTQPTYKKEGQTHTANRQIQ